MNCTLLFLMTPPMLNERNRGILATTIRLLEQWNISYVNVTSTPEMAYSMGAYVHASDYVENRAPACNFGILQHSMHLQAPLPPTLPCPITSMSASTAASYGMNSRHAGMRAASDLFRHSFNASCAAPCSGTRMDRHVAHWRTFRDNSVLFTPQARQRLTPLARALRQINHSKALDVGFERLWGVLSDYTRTGDGGTSCELNIGRKIHGRTG